MGIGIGTTEDSDCVAPLTNPGPSGEQMCLAHKYSYHQLFLPAYVTDDGYILKILGTNKYYPLTADRITEDQQIGMLPTPLPTYSMAWSTYAFGYSLWPVLALLIFVRWFKWKRSKSRMETDALVDISTGPAALVTPGDQFIHDQVAPQLHAGEVITHQAYGTTKRPGGGMLTAATNKGVLAAATCDRVFLITTRVGAFKPILENKGLEVLERAQIREITRRGATLTISLVEGGARTMFVGTTKRFSSQAAFLRDLPRTFAGDIVAA